LTRHFFKAFFRLSFLDDAGEESFKRAIIGLLAGILSFGFFLARVYGKTYAELGSQSPEFDRSMLQAGQFLMICLPMLTTACAVACVSQSLFPDELDFRILMALPISRLRVFVAKLQALFLFAAAFIAASVLAFDLPFTLVTSGHVAEHTLIVRALAQFGAATLAALFAVASIVAIQGLAILLTPHVWRRSMSVVTQTVLICGLVLLIPVVARAGSIAPQLRAEAPSLFLLAPAWFLGVQQSLLGNREPFFWGLAAAGLVGMTAMMALCASCYLILYRRFDRVILQTTAGRAPLRWNVRLEWPFKRHAGFEAVRTFTSTTLRRSGLHQLVCFGAFASGFAFALNGLLGSIGLPGRWLMQSSLEAPLTLSVAAIIGVRAAMLLPGNLRAGWIFRLTEAATTRPHQLNAVRHTLMAVGVVAPAVIAFPVQAAVLGVPSAVAAFPVVVLLGGLVVEAVTINWRRIPFTCTVLFGKRPAALLMLFAYAGFSVLVTIGAILERAAVFGPRAWLTVVSILLLIGAGLRWLRLRTWGQLPLEFEDYLLDTIQPLGIR
jgi:hypothetical protein